VNKTAFAVRTLPAMTVPVPGKDKSRTAEAFVQALIAQDVPRCVFTLRIDPERKLKAGSEEWTSSDYLDY
jgi:hypothetical protein